MRPSSALVSGTIGRLAHLQGRIAREAKSLDKEQLTGCRPEGVNLVLPQRYVKQCSRRVLPLLGLARIRELIFPHGLM